MEAWRKCWREGVAPCLSVKALEALREALVKDDPRLIQGATIQPLPSLLMNPIAERACALAFCGWRSQSLETVNEVNHYFAELCADIGLRLNDIAGCRFFLTWFDETPREEMRRELLPEVELAIASREAVTA